MKATERAQPRARRVREGGVPVAVGYRVEVETILILVTVSGGQHQCVRKGLWGGVDMVGAGQGRPCRGSWSVPETVPHGTIPV